MEDNKGQILLCQTPDGEARIEVRMQGETVWLNLDQMAELIQRNKSTISKHIRNAFAQHCAIKGKTQNHPVDNYIQDLIISVGYLLYSFLSRCTILDVWITRGLKEYILKGFALKDGYLKRAIE